MKIYLAVECMKSVVGRQAGREECEFDSTYEQDLNFEEGAAKRGRDLMVKIEREWRRGRYGCRMGIIRARVLGSKIFNTASW